MKTLTDNLSRARLIPEAAALRAAAGETPQGDGRTLYGHFSVFNNWYEINSFWEGQFLERIAPGAFKRTIGERGGQVKALYDHGQDPQLGNKPLGPFRELSEDNVGGYYEIGLIETDYNNGFIIPAARAGLLGASFRFSVKKESWDDEPKASDYNPRALPERTITDVDLFELGPVTFPASAAADANLRSTTDSFFDRLLTDDRFVARFAKRIGPNKVDGIVRRLSEEGPGKMRARLVRALGTDDAAALQQLLVQLAAADAAFDPIVDAMCGADGALDLAQATIAALLGQPNPDADAADDDEPGDMSGDMPADPADPGGRSSTPRVLAGGQRRASAVRDVRSALVELETLRLPVSRKAQS